jgi:putative ABC transport system permease protein
VFRSGLRLALGGLLVGTAVVVPLVALLRADLHGVAPIEPLGLAADAVIVFLATAAASYIPALRITRVAPVESLRAD